MFEELGVGRKERIVGCLIREVPLKECRLK